MRRVKKIFIEKPAGSICVEKLMKPNRILIVSCNCKKYKRISAV